MNAPPETFEAWQRCIEHDCGITLTKAFVEERLLALRDRRDPSTARLAELCGEVHVSNLVSWFERAARQLV